MKFYEQFFKDNKYIEVRKINHDINSCSKFCNKCRGSNSQFAIVNFPIIGKIVNLSMYPRRSVLTYYITFLSEINGHTYSIKCNDYDIHQIDSSLIDLLYKK